MRPFERVLEPGLEIVQAEAGQIGAQRGVLGRGTVAGQRRLRCLAQRRREPLARLVRHRPLAPFERRHCQRPALRQRREILLKRQIGHDAILGCAGAVIGKWWW